MCCAVLQEAAVSIVTDLQLSLFVNGLFFEKKVHLTGGVEEVGILQHTQHVIGTPDLMNYIGNSAGRKLLRYIDM